MGILAGKADPNDFEELTEDEYLLGAALETRKDSSGRKYSTVLGLPMGMNSDCTAASGTLDPGSRKRIRKAMSLNSLAQTALLFTMSRMALDSSALIRAKSEGFNLGFDHTPERQAVYVSSS